MFEKIIAMFRGKSTPSLPTSRVSSLPSKDTKSIWHTENSSPSNSSGKKTVPSDLAENINPFQSSLNKEDVARQGDSLVCDTWSENKDLRTINLFVSRPDEEATLTGYNIYDEVIFNTSAYCNPSQKLANHYGNPECDPLYRFGRTPSGKYVFDCVLPPNSNPNSPFAGFPILRFLPISGECARAESNGRNALMIIGSPGNPDACPKLDTDGSIRVSGNDIEQLVEILKNTPSNGVKLIVSYSDKKQDRIASAKNKSPISVVRFNSASRTSSQYHIQSSDYVHDDGFLDFLLWSQIYNNYIPSYAEEPDYQWPAPDTDRGNDQPEYLNPSVNDTEQNFGDGVSPEDDGGNKYSDDDGQTAVLDSIKPEDDSDPFGGSGIAADTSFSSDTDSSWATDTTY